ncbi:MAG: hypothetical protein EOM91_12140 [Sphingobacteriia bacterium]|nr:hypothetical protein [Sphingobacteriia bacterium]
MVEAAPGADTKILIEMLLRMSDELRGLRDRSHSDLVRAVSAACAKDIALHCDDLVMYDDSLAL